MPWDFKLDKDTNDIVIDRFDIAFTSSKEELLRQRISITLKTWLEEWFFDTTFGLPYRQKILGGKITRAEIDALIISKILEYEDVKEVYSFTSELDKRNRYYDAIFRLRTVTGNEAFYLRAAQYDQGVVYPDPPPPPPYVCEFATINAELSNEFYTFINVTLPEGVV